ncbi:PTS sugar transporter subunit IIA [Methylobacterium nodulans]|uniref:Putative PTS IIA-like nitrogen-regulatory protein PtsN n=1 Tax=Methylobacterium nodulans (strain LMG 21967 / CNCM I-2342 / ORS 2060) TaxID=460265 RepID=B8I9J1_METNO|nr:PTS sugar transporter subunit IIA [Methylobacterium nodulans]ACL55244.1 putative PTS IIA-like nitrogen-regulatory protein PtsN [Methylobacterium nodulans ORS 2060]
MTLEDLLSPDQAVTGLRVGGKDALLEEMARRAGRATGLGMDAILSALVKREALGSTGVGDGVALPHGRLAGLARPFGLLASLRAAIAYEAVDDRPVDLVVLLLLPRNAEGADLNALACVARRLRDRRVADAMRAARDAAQLYAAACGAGSLTRSGA